MKTGIAWEQRSLSRNMWTIIPIHDIKIMHNWWINRREIVWCNLSDDEEKCKEVFHLSLKQNGLKNHSLNIFDS